jgi:mannose-6-phosphate isomerase-like protein (cupin superfamily)
MLKTNPKELNFPTWSEVSKYGIKTLRAGETVRAHFHDCNEFWIIIKGTGIATSENVTHELGPGDMLIAKAGDKHSLVVIEGMVAAYFQGVMPPDGRFGYLYSGIDLPFPEWQQQKQALAENRTLAHRNLNGNEEIREFCCDRGYQSAEPSLNVGTRRWP